MLEIVLLILKIAGIILAAVLGILITGLFCVLFVPVRYRGDFLAADGEDGKKEIGVVLRAVWLLRLVRVYVSYEESVRVRIKLLFFTLMDTAKEKKARKKRKETESGKRAHESGTGTGNRQKADDETGREAEDDAAENKSGQKGGALESKPGQKAGALESEPERKAGAPEDDPGQKQRNGSVKKKKPSSKEKKGIKKRISNILQTIREFCDKLKRIKEKAEQVKELWKADHMVSARGLLFRQFLYLLKHTKPRKLEGYLRFGFEDPSVTGYAMAVYGISCSIWRPRLSVEPDFEKQVLDCHVRLKGKIRACHFLKAVLSLFFSKDVRHVIKDIKEL